MGEQNKKNTGSSILDKYGVTPRAAATNTSQSSSILNKYGVKSARETAESSTSGMTPMEALGSGIDLGLTTLGYPLRVIRTAAMNVNPWLSGYEKVSGKEIRKPGDLARALKGNAPTMKEYAERMGVSSTPLSVVAPILFSEPGSGGRTDIRPERGGMLDVSPAGVIGAASEAAMDYGITKAGAETMRSAGKGLYKIPFKKIDAKLAQEGKGPLSESLFSRGKNPITKSGVLSDIEASIPAAVSERTALETPVISSGARGSAKNALAAAQEKVNQLSVSGSAKDRALAVSLQKEIDDQLLLGERAPVPPKQVQVNTASPVLDKNGNPIISTRTETIPGIPGQAGPTYLDLIDIKRGASSSTTFPKSTSTEDEFWKKVGGGARQESERVASELSPDLGRKIREKNAEISTLLSSLPQAERDAIVASGKVPITQIDTALLAADPGIYAAKNVGRLMQLPGAFTIPGRASYNLGNFADKLNPYISPWMGLENLREKK